MAEIKYIQSELEKHIYFELKKTAEKKGISIKEAIREAVLEWVRDLSQKHDEIYEEQE
jgi:hypothetical protein